MSRTIGRELSKTIRQKREQLLAIREEVEDLIDYLEVLEARARDKNKPRALHSEIMKRYRVK
jgi:tRNA U34 5-carboxymethylaminomethyl modifying GTPase MnmE/TrmE